MDNTSILLPSILRELIIANQIRLTELCGDPKHFYVKKEHFKVWNDAVKLDSEVLDIYEQN